ncbi:hypothetical protein ACV34M_30810, partial [Pseudomonas aeruginosa]
LLGRRIQHSPQAVRIAAQVQLAERLAGELDLRSDPHSLRRVLDTPAQQGLDATVRRRNLRHAFALAPA